MGMRRSSSAGFGSLLRSVRNRPRQGCAILDVPAVGAPDAPAHPDAYAEGAA